MKRLTKEKIKKIIETGGYTSRSLDPAGALERFADRIMDEMVKKNKQKNSKKD